METKYLCQNLIWPRLNLMAPKGVTADLFLFVIYEVLQTKTIYVVSLSCKPTATDKWCIKCNSVSCQHNANTYICQCTDINRCVLDVHIPERQHCFQSSSIIAPFATYDSMYFCRWATYFLNALKRGMNLCKLNILEETCSFNQCEEGTLNQNIWPCR